MGLYSYRNKYLNETAFLNNVLNQADIYHSPFTPIPVKIRQHSIKKFITVYDLIPILMPQFFPRQEGDHIVKQAIHSLDKEGFAFTISQATKDDLCNYYQDIEPNRVFVTHLAAARDIFYPCQQKEQIELVKQKYKIPEEPYFLTLSTLEPRKNIDHLIRCFARLLEEESIKDVNLVLVGAKGWDASKIFSELGNQARIKSRIIVTGYVADEDLAALYSGAIGFGYISFYEGFGLPPLEAMQCGIPVITSNTSSLPEVVGDAGIKVNPSDEDALCQALLDVYSNSALRKKMASASLAQAATFSWEKCIQQTVAGYKSALNR
jgi:glycosyltransferase involved in cell wall biosynthesis